MIGSSIGPYRVVDVLGAGGMGMVFLADDTRLKRRVALKVVAGATLGAADARGRLLGEARAAARLNHPHIAAVYDVLDDPSGPSIVMEYVPGETLAARLRQGPLPAAQAVTIGLQLSDALAHAHASGVVHGDLKPGNVVVTPDGAVKILDFGLARIREIERADDTQSLDLSTPSNKLAGTPAYMAPEQLLGKPATRSSDIYALGVLLFELFSGRRPFEGADFLALGMAVLGDPIPHLPVGPGVVGDIVARAMSREPAERHQSAAELSADLRRAQRVLADQTTMADPVAEASLGRGRGPKSEVRGPAFAQTLRRGRPESEVNAGRHRTPDIGHRTTWLSRRRVLAIPVLMVALLAAVFVWGFAGSWLTGSRRLALGTAAPPIVAVLPLRNLSGDLAKDYLGVGVAESLIAALASGSTAVVIPQQETGGYLGRAADARTVTRDLGATVLVDGGVQQTGDLLRFTVKAVRADGTVAWANSYEGSMTDLFPLQRRAAGDLLSALGIDRAPHDGKADVPSTSVDVYADYSMGRTLLSRRDVPGNADRAVAAFERAVARDSRFGPAFAGLGDACWWRYKETNDGTWVPRAVDAVQHAVALDPHDARSRVSLATILAGTGKNADAIKELRSAIAARPVDDEAHRLLADVLVDAGKQDEALKEYRKAIQLRPNYFRNQSALGGLYFRAGRYSEAVSAYERVTEVQPDSTWGFINLGAAYLAAGDFGRALANFQRSLTLAPEAEAYSNIGTIYYMQGKYADATVAYERAIALAPRNPISHRNLGDALIRLGAGDKARAEYRRAADEAAAVLRVNPRDVRMRASRALYLAKAGRGGDALRDATEVAGTHPDDAEVLYMLAAVHALCARPADATNWLERALARGYSRTMANEDEDLASIRSSKRVQSALSAR